MGLAELGTWNLYAPLGAAGWYPLGFLKYAAICSPSVKRLPVLVNWMMWSTMYLVMLSVGVGREGSMKKPGVAWRETLLIGSCQLNQVSLNHKYNIRTTGL